MCREKGAIGVEGFPCPQCAYWDGAKSGLNPGCETCCTRATVNWDPDEERAMRPISCPWCKGRGYVSASMNIWGCRVCNGLGRAELSVIDLTTGYGRDEGDDPAPINERDMGFSSEAFAESRIANATFTDCSFTGVSFAKAELTDVAFVRCNVIGTDFTTPRLLRVKFETSQLSASGWSQARIQDVELMDCETATMVIEPELHAHFRIKSGPSGCSAS
jgi:hypothetical protein